MKTVRTRDVVAVELRETSRQLDIRGVDDGRWFRRGLFAFNLAFGAPVLTALYVVVHPPAWKALATLVVSVAVWYVEAVEVSRIHLRGLARRVARLTAEHDNLTTSEVPDAD